MVKHHPMTNVHEMWMREVLSEAERAGARGEVPIAAILVCEGELLAVGSNLRETTHHTTGHAEIVALETYNERQKSWRLPPGSALYVNAEPCVMCAGALLQARIGAIYYGCDDPKNAGLRNLLPLIEANRFDHKPSEIVGGVLAESSAVLLGEFFRRRRLEKAAVKMGISRSIH
jgi:tRNA(adenine34) deaminase